MEKEVLQTTIAHCMLHRHALALKTLPQKLKQHLATTVNVVNYIWGWALNHCIFRAFLEEIGADHTVFLYHTDIRWFSKGCKLSRVFEMHEEIILFLTNQNCNLVKHFERRDAILREYKICNTSTGLLSRYIHSPEWIIIYLKDVVRT